MGKKYLGNLRIGFVSFIMFFALSLLVSCGGGGGDDEGAPSVGSITVDAGSDEIVADGVSRIWVTATVLNSDGDPVDDDTTVVFTTTAGALSPASAQTYDGMATVYLRSSTTVGTATVTATAAGASSSVSVNFIPSNVASISLTANPGTLNADGASTSTIRAEVRDSQGNSVGEEVISFSITSGTGTLSESTVTTVSGVAALTYTASNRVGFETITAWSANGISGSVTITLISAIVGSVTVSAGSSEITANGISQTLIMSTVKDVNGNNVADGTAVNFSTSAGTLSAAISTTVNGIATATLTSSATVGTAIVTVTAGGVLGTTTVNFIPGAPNIINLTATPNNLSADGASTSTIRAVVNDARGNAVANGEVISFRVTTGTGLLSAPTATTTNGVATLTYTASNSVGFETITALAANGISGSVTITLISAIVGSVTVSAGSSEITADGISQTLIMSTVKDINGNNVVDGTAVNFSTSAGNLSAATSTTVNGIATATLTSSVTVGTAIVTVTAGGVLGTTTVNFIPGAPNIINLTATPNNLSADGASTSTIRAVVNDARGNAVANGEVISFRVTTGTGLLSAPTATTTNGVATLTYTASNSVGFETITALSANGISGSVTITLISAIVGSVTVSPGSSEIAADGISQTLIMSTVKDINGNNVADGTAVNFSTSAGTLSAATSTTVNGIATSTLTSSVNVGTATVTVTAGGVSATTAVLFVSGAVSTIRLTATPGILAADGASTSEISATVTDANGNAVDNETITFTIVQGSGSFSAPTATTGGGVATVTYTASQNPGTVVIEAASTNSTSSTIDILLMGGGDPVAEEFGVFAAFLNISGLWRMNLEDQITVGLADVYGNAVDDTTRVDFKTYNTGGLITPNSAETVSGFASTSLFSTPNPVPLQGFLSVTAETEGGHTTRATAIEVTPFPDNHIVYLGTNGGGIYKSTDSGQTWENVSRSILNSRSGENFIDPYIKGHSAICVDPDNHNTVYAGTGYLGRGNVFRSLDGGMNWNSDNPEEWGGLYMYTPDAAIVPAPPSANVISNAAVLTVLCDGDDDPLTDNPYVWIGTEGKGFLFAADGKHFQPSGGTVNPIAPTQTGSPIYVNPENTGNGHMTEPMLWYTSLTEDWTATCYVPVDAYATVAVPGTDNVGTGLMSNIETSPQTVTENWEAVYTGRAGTVYFTQGIAPARNPGNIINIKFLTSETWTVQCINADTPGSEEFSVQGTLSGRRPNAFSGIIYTDDVSGLEFSWVDGVDDFLVGDRFVFTTNYPSPVFTGSSTNTDTLINIQSTSTENWEMTYTIISTEPTTNYAFSVSGSVSGTLPNAVEGVDYTEPQLSFSWVEGPDDFVPGDKFEFSTIRPQVSFFPASVSYINHGSLGNISINNALSETWTVRCIDATPVFSVTGSISGAHPDASTGDYGDDSSPISFTINDGTDPWLVGSRFTFTTTTWWQVSGTVSGPQTNTATTGVSYNSDGNQVRFRINAGAVPYCVGDSFAFSTFGASSPFWRVEGSVSGLQSGIAQMGQLYRSDNNEVGFMIIEGSTPFATDDRFKFHVGANNLNHGRTVWDIKQVGGTHGSDAILYAGTSIGVFKSINGGRTWTETGNFTGDYIICIELHPGSTGGAGDVIYAGTQNGAVWVSTNSGVNWTRYSSGMTAGSFIKDIVLDPTNNFLYAITYDGPVETASSSVYVHKINTDGSMGTEGWKAVSSGLAGTALHTLAIDNPAEPGILFTGGEGISFSRADTDLETGNPTWMDSNNGLSNIIMARMPILFSGQCSMSWDITRYDNTVWFKVYIEDQNGNPPIEGSTFTAVITPSEGDEWTAYDIEYPDCYTHTGTFRDPGNPSTNNPYWFSFTISPPESIDEESTVDVELTFTPENTLPDAPGSSGQEQTYKWTFAYRY